MKNLLNDLHDIFKKLLNFP